VSVPKEIFTIKDLMAYTNYSDSTIHKLSAKSLYTIINTNALFFDRGEIVAWIREHKVYSGRFSEIFLEQLKK
jgi:predicted DNA-binding transcriptional regulator AlpA